MSQSPCAKSDNKQSGRRSSRGAAGSAIRPVSIAHNRSTTIERMNVSSLHYSLSP